MKKNILIVCHDVVGQKMAGPGIRYHNIARILKSKNNVDLAVFSESNIADENYMTIKTSGDGFKKYFDKYDFIFAQWLSKEMIDYSIKTGKIVIFDLYAPVPIEYLASLEFSNKLDLEEKNEKFIAILNMYDRFLQIGQFFTCSNERQRDFWIGYITAIRLLKPGSLLKENILNKFTLCPMGIDSKPPNVKKLQLRDSINEISKDDFVLVWTGGIWDWFDAQLVIKAMSKLSNNKIKLVFLGTKHPNSNVEEMNESKEAIKLAENLKLINKTVFFLDDWIPYSSRANYFVDADAAIYADKLSLEMRFSHRTRVLDHFWTELPTICTAGDYLSDIIQREEFGLVIKDRTSELMADAINELVGNKDLYNKIKTNIKLKKNNYTWEKTLEPLVNFIDSADIKVMSSNIKKEFDPDHNKLKPSFRKRAKLSAKIILGK